MDEISRYAVGLDVGTENVRAVVAAVSKDGKVSVVGYNEANNAGMRKGTVANLAGPADSIDKMLGEVERMSGQEINSATISVNGAQILTTRTEGMIAVGAIDHEINGDDLARVEDVATTGRIPANRDILEVVPLDYVLDGQNGIKDPIGMTGARLEMRASVVSALTPNCENLRKAVEGAGVRVERMVPSAVAAAKAVLNERQMENGVAVIDLGAATTSVAIFEEGELQYVGVVPAGSNNITNDLAIMLEIDMEMAEEIKRRFVTGDFENAKDAPIKVGKEEKTFERAQVDEVVKARLDEIFEKVRKELKNAHYERRLPEGVVLVGGGAKMRGIDIFAKQALNAAVKIGVPKAMDGVAEAIQKPEYAATVGLMLMAIEGGGQEMSRAKKAEKGENWFKRLLSKF